LHRFPKYKSLDNRVSIWGESYGGHWATNTADYFEQQNDKIVAGVLNNTSIIPLHLDTVGFINACIDIDTQMIFYPEFAHNNTYGIQAINDTQYTSAIAASPVCKNMTARCRNLAAAKDPDGVGNHPDVNTACYAAFNYCFANMHDAYVKSGVTIHFPASIVQSG
jgi:carboxypeptidase C (cathepsin A)